MVFMASRHGFLPEALVSLSALYRKKHVGCIYADRAHGFVLACCRALFAAVSLALAAIWGRRTGAEVPSQARQKPGPAPGWIPDREIRAAQAKN